MAQCFCIATQTCAVPLALILSSFFCFSSCFPLFPLPYSITSWSVPYLRWIVAGFSPRRPRFRPRFFSEHLKFLPTNIIRLVPHVHLSSRDWYCRSIWGRNTKRFSLNPILYLAHLLDFLVPSVSLCFFLSSWLTWILPSEFAYIISFIFISFFLSFPPSPL